MNVKSNIKIGVLTYRAHHRKTYDTVTLLSVLGYKNVTVYATPFKYKKNFSPIYAHRPAMYDFSALGIDVNNSSIYENMGYRYLEIDNYNELDDKDNEVYLVCGAGILPNEFIKKNRVVNSHPGFIPYVRGLDALKWAIIEEQAIGVTTHFLGDQVDAGEVIQRIKVPVFKSDLFYQLAERQYQFEICALVNSIKLLDDKHNFYDAGENEQHRRMPSDVEANLLNAFEKYKEKYGIDQ